jgi:hypothetical protein
MSFVQDTLFQDTGRDRIGALLANSSPLGVRVRSHNENERRSRTNVNIATYLLVDGFDDE